MNNLLYFRISGQEDLDKLAKGLASLSDLTDILDEGAAVLFNRMRTHFIQQTDPQGHKWPVSEAARHRSKIGRGGGTLFDTGKLFYSLQLFADTPTTRSIGTDATSIAGFPYPKLHNYGLGGQERRQFLGFGSADVHFMSDLVVKRIAERFGI